MRENVRVCFLEGRVHAKEAEANSPTSLRNILFSSVIMELALFPEINDQANEAKTRAQ